MPLAAHATRAAVVDDLHLVCSGLTQVLRQAGATTVDSYGSSTAVADIEVGRCDLVLVGPHLVGPASELVAELRAGGFRGVIVHLAVRVSREEFVGLLRSGADAVASFTSGPDELRELLRRVSSGERAFDGVSLEAVRPTLVIADAAGALSARERQVLALLATRRTMSEIAGELFVSVATVKSHASHLYAKLGVRGRAEAVDRAFAARIFELVA